MRVLEKVRQTIFAGADPGEVKWVNFHSPFSEPPSFFFFFTGLPIGKPSRGLRLVCLFSFFSFFSFSFFFFFFFRVGKSLACHSPGKWCLCA